MDSEDIKRYLLSRLSHKRNVWIREYLRGLALSYAEKEKEIKILGPDCDSDEERLDIFLSRSVQNASIRTR